MASTFKYPRSAYLTVVGEPMAVNGQDDVAKAEWWSLSALPELAFDHVDIMQDASKKYKEVMK
jgi:8-oxo-dGTP diphosphatase